MKVERRIEPSMNVLARRRKCVVAPAALVRGPANAEDEGQRYVPHRLFPEG